MIRALCDSEISKNLPNNVEWKKDVHGKEYLDYLSRCKAVIVPLNTMYSDISAGQLVIIQGLMFGKIVVATRTVTAESYIEDKENGILISNTCDELNAALDAIEHGEYDYIRDAARRYYEENYKESNMAQALADALLEIERNLV